MTTCRCNQIISNQLLSLVWCDLDYSSLNQTRLLVVYISETIQMMSQPDLIQRFNEFRSQFNQNEPEEFGDT